LISIIFIPNDLGYHGFSNGDGSRFVKDDRINVAGGFQTSASRIRMPCSAAFPNPTIRAVGVASPSAQGQAMTRT